MSEESHHVAWADRIGLNKQWARDIQTCGDAFGSDMYLVAVRRFKNDIPDIKSGPQLKTKIKEFEEGELNEFKKILLYEWKKNFEQEAKNESFVAQKQDEINMYAAEELYKYIIQMLEDHGFAFYEATDVKTGRDGYKHYEAYSDG